MNSRHLQFYLTTVSPCSYFQDKHSCNLIPDPKISLNMPLYNQLIQHGFRRSGKHCYRPHCHSCEPSCQDCIACRIPVQTFHPSRAQKRCLRKNHDLDFSVSDACYNNEYFDLYRKYLNSRHADGSMADPCEDDYKQFLYCDWCDTRFLEWRLQNRLVAVAVTDIMSDGLSAVYSFFDPELNKRSLGTFCILKQIEYARNEETDFVYLGYWINNHKKMGYKNKFSPIQLYLDERWQERDKL